MPMSTLAVVIVVACALPVVVAAAVLVVVCRDAAKAARGTDLDEQVNDENTPIASI